jgi:hypothetical protein
MLSSSAASRRDLTVACVLRSGGDYDVDYVEKLRDGVARHLSLAHRFVCLSDVEVPCDRVPILRSWSGWWSKLELFEWFTGPTLYFDLDTVIVGSIDDIANYPHQFSMLSDFGRPSSCASGVMAWCGDFSNIALEFSEERAADYLEPTRWGDQAWISETVGLEPDRLQELFPRQIVSRKFGARWPGEERVVCFHGVPRPRDVNWTV